MPRSLADREEFELVVALVRSWMDGNPPFRGLNWSSGIELALRVISVALALSMIGVERLDEESRRSILKFFSAHVYWLKRFPSLHSSANNHRIAELAGLIVGLTMAPGAHGAGDQREALLARSARRNRPPDSPGRGRCRAGAGLYRLRHRVVPGRGLCLRKAARSAGGHQRSACGLGRALFVAHGHRRRRYRQSAMPTIAASSRRPRLASRDTWPRSSLRLRAALAAPTLLRQEPIPAFATCFSDRCAASPNERAGLRSFPTGGYSVFRGKGEAPAVLTFDHGPVGYLSIAAHGHADTLAVWLSIGGPADLRRCRHLSLPLARRRCGMALRDTAVHNTLTLRRPRLKPPFWPVQLGHQGRGRAALLRRTARLRGSWPSMTAMSRGLV